MSDFTLTSKSCFPSTEHGKAVDSSTLRLPPPAMSKEWRMAISKQHHRIASDNSSRGWSSPHPRSEKDSDDSIE